MKKKTSRNIILLIIAALVIFVVYDFIKDSAKEDAALEEASQQEETVIEDDDDNESKDEDEEIEAEDESNFSTSEELDEDILENEEIAESKNNSPEINYGANPGDTVYDYELTDIETGELVKVSDYRGEKVFLNFWASWCPPCRVEAPHLQDFSENQEDVVVLGVNVKVSESDEENVHDFIDEFGLTFPNVYGHDDMFGPFFVESLPTSFFIDSKGTIRERVTGPVTEDVLHGIFDMID
ncbi:MAG: redoxin family protein [Atopostipes sp.]|nr:redoxin family protein [Atopostipes sp.]